MLLRRKKRKQIVRLSFRICAAMIGRRFIPILNESWMKRLFPNWRGGVETLIDLLDNSTDVEAQRLEPYQSQIRAQLN